MNNKNLCFRIDGASLYFAGFDDMELVYNMMHEDNAIREMLFYGENEAGTFDEFVKTESNWFPGAESKNAYYLIEYENEFIGWISHSYNAAKIENMEIDIAFNSFKHTGKGLGTKIIKALTHYAHEKYDIKTFMIRPGKHNTQAIRAYEKCGFKIAESYNPNDYYTAEDVVLWGDGDLGIENTLNMLKVYDD